MCIRDSVDDVARNVDEQHLDLAGAVVGCEIALFERALERALHRADGQRPLDVHAGEDQGPRAPVGLSGAPLDLLLHAALDVAVRPQPARRSFVRAAALHKAQHLAELEGLAGDHLGDIALLQHAFANPRAIEAAEILDRDVFADAQHRVAAGQRVLVLSLIHICIIIPSDANGCL